jgi:hypothetical protein
MLNQWLLRLDKRLTK